MLNDVDIIRIVLKSWTAEPRYMRLDSENRFLPASPSMSRLLLFACCQTCLDVQWYRNRTIRGVQKPDRALSTSVWSMCLWDVFNSVGQASYWRTMSHPFLAFRLFMLLRFNWAKGIQCNFLRDYPFDVLLGPQLWDLVTPRCFLAGSACDSCAHMEGELEPVWEQGSLRYLCSTSGWLVSVRAERNCWP